MKLTAKQIFAYQWECPFCLNENITSLKDVSFSFGEKWVKCKYCQAEVEVDEVDYDLDMK